MFVARSVSLVIVAVLTVNAHAKLVCFTVTSSGNSTSTTKLFEARHCQGGGVTWAAILEALARREGTVAPVTVPTPGWLGGVYTLNGSRFAVDDEAEAALFCAADPKLIVRMKAEYKQLNSDVKALQKAMAEADPAMLECFDEHGQAPTPKMNPLPTLPAHMVANTHAQIELMKAVLLKQPSWCFPGGDAFEGKTGVLRFQADNQVIYVGTDGKERSRGTMSFGAESMGDSRVQVFMPAMLVHLDIGVSGRPGRTPADGIRQELVPGEGCLKK